MAEIRIPPVLRPDAGGQRLVDVEADTVREALDTLVARFPALKARVFEGDGVPSFLNVFVDGSDVRLLSGLETSVSAASKILLLPAVAGGSPTKKETPGTR
jgi:molybdopterin synthase sulfur carrier subunit